jgi:hypothetical protein
MSSIAELRAKLKKSQNKQRDGISSKTAMEILLKLIRDGKLSEQVIFTMDGQELLTQKVLMKEIEETLVSVGGRARISELSRSLNVAEETILATVKLLGLTMYLNEVITSEWFTETTAAIGKWLDHVGELKFTQISDRYHVSLELVKTRLVANFPLREDDRILSEKFKQLILARTRGTINALTVPRDIKTIASQIGGDVETVKECVSRILETAHPSGTLGNDGMYVPFVWMQTQGESALMSWKISGWCEVGMLKYAVDKSNIPNWLREQSLEETRDFLILNGKHMVRISMLRDRLNAMNDLWVDIDQVSKSVFPGLGSISKHLGCEFFSGWHLSGQVAYRRDAVINKLIAKVSLKESSKIEQKLGSVVESELRIFRESEYRQAFDDIVQDCLARIRPMIEEIRDKNEMKKLKPSISTNLESLTEIEETIKSLFWEINDNINTADKILCRSIIEPEIKRNILNDLVELAFRYTHVRVCGGGKYVDRSMVLRSIPNSPVADDQKKALKFLLEITDFISVDDLRDALSELAIVVPKQAPKRRGAARPPSLEELRRELQVIDSEQERTILSIQIGLMEKFSNHRLTCLRSDSSPEVFKGICEKLEIKD